MNARIADKVSALSASRIDAWLTRTSDQSLVRASWLVPSLVGLVYLLGFVLYVAVWGA